MQKSVVVCGGGVIGLTSALRLAQAGHRVTLLEREPEGGDSCSLGNAGYVSVNHVIPLAAPGMGKVMLQGLGRPRRPFYVQPRLDPAFWRWSWLFLRAGTPARVAAAAPLLRDLALASRSWYEGFARTHGNAFDLALRGHFNICRTEAALAELAAESRFLREHGVEAEVLTAAETARRQPGVRMAIVGSVFYPADSHLHPPALIAALVAAVKALGVDLRWSTAVTGWRTAAGRVAAAVTAAGEVAADEFVLAGGSWSTGLAGQLGLRLPIEAGKGYSLTLPRPPSWPGATMTCVESRVGVSPTADRLRFAGTMELTGLNDVLRPERVEQIIRSVPEYFPEWRESDLAGIQPWFGRRPLSADGLPYIGRFGPQPNLIAACGHSMLGMSLAPATAQLVAELVGEEKPSFPLPLLSPDRYR